MLDIQKSIKRIIERFIVNKVPLIEPVSTGSTTVKIETTRRFCVGEGIVVYNKPAPTIQATGEVHIISDIIDRNTIIIDSGLVADYPLLNSFVEKLIGYESGNEQFIDGVYIGDPAVIPRYPAITIDAKSRSSEWITLESTSEQFDIDITVYVQASDFELQYEMMHAYVKAIESSLFRSFFPLVEPYDITTLAADVEADDTTIQVSNGDFLVCPTLSWIWLESVDFLRPNRIKKILSPNVFELQFPTGREFEAGDTVIRPHRHIYNTLPHSTQYGTVNKGTMLKAAVISYKAQEERRRYVPYLDPLTF